MRKSMVTNSQFEKRIYVLEQEKDFANKQALESTSLFLDLSGSLLEKIDLFLSNTNLDKNQQITLMKLFKEVYIQGNENQNDNI